MYNIFGVEIGLNKWLSKDAINLTFPADSVSASSLGNTISGGVSLSLLADGEMTSLMSVAKLSFDDPVEGKMEGLDTDGKYKWIIGSGTSSIDWSVTYPDVLTVTGITLTGGTLNYGKTSFTDSTNAGYILDSNGVYIGAASDATFLKYDIGTGLIDYVGTISLRATSTIAAAINSSGDFVNDLINARIDTEAKTILSDFDFGAVNYAGAVKSGDLTWNTTTGAITGGSGVAIYRGGIVGASSGVATFSIDATTGNATFAGELVAATGTFAGSLTVGAIPGIPTDTSLVGYWNFDEGSGTLATDYSSIANNGTTSGALYTDGISGKCLDFDGVDDYVSIPHDASQLLTTGFTLSAWVKCDGVGNHDSPRIFDKTTDTSGAGGFAYWVDTSANKMGITVNAGTSISSADGSIVDGDGNWYFVAVTVTSDATVTHYINGVASGTPGATGDLSGITTTNDLRIGNRSNATDRSFLGQIDEPRIYNRALTANEVTALYKNPSGVTQQGVKQLGGTYATGTSGAYMKFNPTDGLYIQDDTSAPVFEVETSGTDVGDVTIGDYANSKGVKYDKSAGTFTIAKDTTFVNSNSDQIEAQRSFMAHCEYRPTLDLSSHGVQASQACQMSGKNESNTPYLYLILNVPKGSLNQEPYLMRYSLTEAGTYSYDGTVVSKGSGDIYYWGVVQIGSYVYASYSSGIQYLYRYNLDLTGETAMTWSGHATTIGYLASDGTNLYITTSTSSHNILKFSISGTTITYVSDTAFGTIDGVNKYGLWADSTYMYWLDLQGNVSKYLLNGTLVGTQNNYVCSTYTAMERAIGICRMGDKLFNIYAMSVSVFGETDISTKLVFNSMKLP